MSALCFGCGVMVDDNEPAHRHASPAQQAPALLAGLDVSQFQAGLNWGAVVDAGVAAREPLAIAYYRATLGPTYRDPLATHHRAGARAAGLRVGAYHVLTAGPVAAQARAFLDAIGPDREALPEMLPPMLDLERGDAGAGADAGRRALEWLETVGDALSCAPLLYTYPSFARAHELGDVEALAAFPLWIAHYGVEAPSVPAPWSDWMAWQWTGTGRVGGYAGAVDRSWWRGYP